MIRVTRLAVAGLVGWAGLGLTTAGAAAPVEKALPANTVLLVKAQDTAKLREAVKESQIGRLLADPAMKAVKDDIAAKLEKPSNQLQGRLGLSLEELLTLPTGDASVAVIATAAGASPVSVLISADAGENQQKMADLMAKLTKMVQEDGKGKVGTETFQDLTITVITYPAEDDRPEMTGVWVKAGSVFHISNSVAALKDVLAHADGREDCLASNKSFQTVGQKVGDAGQVLWFLDIEQSIKLALSSLGEQGNADQIDAQLQLTGLKGLKALGGRAGFNQGGYDAFTKTFAYAPGDKQGLLKLLTFPTASIKPEAWVPAGVASYQTLNWDLDAFYSSLNELVDTLAPGVLANLEQQIAGPQGEGLSFQKDIFGPLGDRITVITDFEKPVTENSQRFLFAIALEDAKAFEKTLNKIFGITNASPKKRDFQGSTIYDIDLPEIPNAEEAGLPRTLSLTIAKDSLLVASKPTLLEQVLRGGPGLADNPDFQVVAKNYPTQVSSFSYQRPDESARVIYDMFKSGQFTDAMNQARQAQGQPDLPPLFDPEKLPDFSVFAKYLSQSGGFGQQEADGMLFTQFSLKKAQP
jgi:hypothetical protein